MLVETRVLGGWGKAFLAFGAAAVLGSLHGDSEQLKWRIGKTTTRVPLAELEKVKFSYDGEDMPKTVFLMRDGGRAVLGQTCHDHLPVLRFVRQNFSGKMTYDGRSVESVDELGSR